MADMEKNQTAREDHPLPQEMTDEAPLLTEAEAEKQIRTMSRRSFLWAGAATIGVVGGLWAFNREGMKEGGTSDGIHKTLRSVLNFNDGVAKTVFFSPTHLARTFPRSEAVEPRNNYKGETPVTDLAAWKLTLSGAAAGERKLTLADLNDLPQVEQTTELKCVEGWSTIVNWGGVRMMDFIKKYPYPDGTTYVSMLSEPEDFPDERYYVGLDLASCLHPQTLLATHINGQKLNAEHGAPLRLVMPTKYGIKNIKLITTIAYAKERPADYWFEQGYDYYAGL